MFLFTCDFETYFLLIDPMLHDFQQEQRFRPRCLAGHIQVLGFVAKIFGILHRQCFLHCTHGFLFARVLVVQHMLHQVFRMEKMCPFVTTCSKVRTNIKISQQFLVLCEQIIGEKTPTRVQMECAKKTLLDAKNCWAHWRSHQKSWRENGPTPTPGALD